MQQISIQSLRTLAFAVGLVALAAGLSAPAAADSGDPDFSLGVNYDPPREGNLVRGGLTEEECGGLCNGGTTEPKYIVVSGFGCFYDVNTIGIVSLNGFEGEVFLDVLNLPSGVTNLTEPSVTVPKDGAVTTPLVMEASSTATTGDATVTLRASSGSIVHELDLPISVADALPPLPCDNPPEVEIVDPTEGSTISGVIAITAETSDPDGEVVNVNFHLRTDEMASGILIGSDEPDAGGVATISWDTTFAGDGPWDLSASAFDDGDNVTTSQLVGVTVDNAPAGADTVTLDRAEFDSDKGELRVEATSTDESATLDLIRTGTGEFIGTLNNEGGGSFKGEFTVASNPENVTVRSSSGGSDSEPVTTK